MGELLQSSTWHPQTMTWLGDVRPREEQKVKEDLPPSSTYFNRSTSLDLSLNTLETFKHKAE